MIFVDRNDPGIQAAMDLVTPFIRKEAIDELVLRLSGRSGAALVAESMRLARAMLAQMRAAGLHVGPVEIAVVCASIEIAVDRVGAAQLGNA